MLDSVVTGPPVAGDLGPCEVDWCDRPAVAYVSGPTAGRSPRLLIVAGERASVLAAANTGLDTYGSLRCLDCVLAAAEDTVVPVPAGPVPA